MTTGTKHKLAVSLDSWTKGEVNGWFCYNCKLYNDILSDECQYTTCHSNRIARDSEEQNLAFLASLTRERRLGSFIRATGKMSKVERNEELFAKFFNDEAKLVAAMDFATLDSHIDDLELVAFEARTRIQSASANKKDRIFNLSQEERDKLISKPDFTSSEKSKLDLPKRQKTSKADKMAEDFKKMGMSDEAIESLLAQVRIKEETEDRKANPHKYLIDKRENVVQPDTNRVRVTQDSLFREAVSLIDAELIKKATVDLLAVATCGLPEESVNMITRSRLHANESLTERYELLKILAPKAAKELNCSISEYASKVLTGNLLVWFNECCSREPLVEEPKVEEIKQDEPKQTDVPSWLPKF